ncbi:MAG: hypothetical protein LBC18_08765 [Opitutaceae bacterium]|jgi:hypothetical protein|nr:hypothetical protein [Opitutaceae bacterium]
MIYANAADYDGEGGFAKTHLVLDGMIPDKALAQTETAFVDAELGLCLDCEAVVCCEGVTVLRADSDRSYNGTHHCPVLFFDILRKKGGGA